MSKIEQAFFKWWNENWPDLAPTHQALHAWQASAREQMERDATICNSYSSGNHRHVADAIRESFEREAGK